MLRKFQGARFRKKSLHIRTEIMSFQLICGRSSGRRGRDEMPTEIGIKAHST